MSDISALLELQKIDLQVDALRKRRIELPERQERVACDAELAKLEEAKAVIAERRDALAVEDRDLAAQVADIVGKAKKAEHNLYSGSVTVPKELESLAEELRLHKAHQEQFEERELELMEQLETVDAELAENATRVQEVVASAAELDERIALAETQIDAELERLEEQKSAVEPGLPAPILEAYARRRDQPRLGGLAAASLVGRSCKGCRVDLPVFECNRIRAEPWDAVVPCMHCTRMLVR